MSNISINLGPRSYQIELGHEVYKQFPTWLNRVAPCNKVCIVIDQNVLPIATKLMAELQSTGCKCHLVQIPPGENQKSLGNLSRLYDELAAMKADRQTPVIALGGGVIGDLAGFAAATFNRGLPLVMVPTTLLAMVDSSVGGKVGINHPAGKNLIGAFHQPRGVWIDSAYLETLPKREFFSGMAEVVKYGMILDAVFSQFLEANVDGISNKDQKTIKHVITRSCQLKAQVVQQDEYETRGLRAKLNFGHTFGHAIETVSGYGKLLHGEAISIGMVCACRLAEQLSMIGPEITIRLKALLARFALPTEVDSSWSIEGLLEAMRHDKKNVADQLRFVLPESIGSVKTGVVVDEQLVQEVLQSKPS